MDLNLQLIKGYYNSKKIDELVDNLIYNKNYKLAFGNYKYTKYYKDKSFTDIILKFLDIQEHFKTYSQYIFCKFSLIKDEQEGFVMSSFWIIDCDFYFQKNEVFEEIEFCDYNHSTDKELLKSYLNNNIIVNFNI